MEQLIVCSSSDLHRLQDVIRSLSVDTMVLMSAGNFDAAILGRVVTDKVKMNLTYNCDSRDSRLELLQQLKGLKRAYFVVSNPVMSSSAYQAMIYSLFPLLLQADCWKITLETANIPRGFAFLRNLPEGLPPQNHGAFVKRAALLKCSLLLKVYLLMRKLGI